MRTSMGYGSLMARESRPGRRTTSMGQGNVQASGNRRQRREHRTASKKARRNWGQGCHQGTRQG